MRLKALLMAGPSAAMAGAVGIESMKSHNWEDNHDGVPSSWLDSWFWFASIGWFDKLLSYTTPKTLPKFAKIRGKKKENLTPIY